MEIKVLPIPDSVSRFMALIEEAHAEIYSTTGISRIFATEEGLKVEAIDPRDFWAPATE